MYIRYENCPPIFPLRARHLYRGPRPRCFPSRPKPSSELDDMTCVERLALRQNSCDMAMAMAADGEPLRVAGGFEICQAYISNCLALIDDLKLVLCFWKLLDTLACCQSTKQTSMR